MHTCIICVCVCGEGACLGCAGMNVEAVHV